MFFYCNGLIIGNYSSECGRPTQIYRTFSQKWSKINLFYCLCRQHTPLGKEGGVYYRQLYDIVMQYNNILLLWTSFRPLYYTIYTLVCVYFSYFVFYGSIRKTTNRLYYNNLGTIIIILCIFNNVVKQ